MNLSVPCELWQKRSAGQTVRRAKRSPPKGLPPSAVLGHFQAKLGPDGPWDRTVCVLSSIWMETGVAQQLQGHSMTVLYSEARGQGAPYKIRVFAPAYGHRLTKIEPLALASRASVSRPRAKDKCFDERPRPENPSFRIHPFAVSLRSTNVLYVTSNRNIDRDTWPLKTITHRGTRGLCSNDRDLHALSRNGNDCTRVKMWALSPWRIKGCNPK